MSKCIYIISKHICMDMDTYGIPDGSNGKESACNEGDSGLIPGSGDPLEGGQVNSLQYYCLENSMDRGVLQATWGCKESDISK